MDTRLAMEVEREVVFDTVLYRLVLCLTALVVLPSLILLLLALLYLAALVRHAVN